MKNLILSLLLVTPVLGDIKGITLLPRQDGIKEGNPARVIVKTSADGTKWSQVADTTLLSAATLKTINFSKVTNHPHIRVEFLTSALGTTTSLAEISLINSSNTVLAPDLFLITSDSQTADHGVALAFDKKPETFWITEPTRPLPHYLQIKVQSAAAGLLEWDPNSPDENVLGYNVFWSLETSTTESKIVVDDATEATLTNMIRGGKYKIQVSAFNETSEGPRSEILFYTVPFKIPGPPNKPRITIVPK